MILVSLSSKYIKDKYFTHRCFLRYRNWSTFSTSLFLGTVFCDGSNLLVDQCSMDVNCEADSLASLLNEAMMIRKSGSKHASTLMIQQCDD